MTTAPEPRRSKYATAFIVIGSLLALMWGLEIIDQLTSNYLDQFGIRPRDAENLPHIATAPWLHFGWGHLISNSGPFLLLGVLNYLAGLARWLVTTGLSILASGLLVWLISPTYTITLGASGLIFGWLTYLLVRGFYTRKISEIVVAVLVFMFYGSILLGVLPLTQGVSWQGHLGGALGGVLAAWWLHRRSRRTQPTAYAG